MPVQKQDKFDWAFWFLWILATALGWFLGGVLLSGIGLVPSGVGIAFLQWLVLQQRIHKAWRWIIVSVIGWSLGWGISLFAYSMGLDFLNGMLIGVATGAAQWLILRQEIQWSGWWIAVSAVAWAAGISLLPGVMLSGTIAGAITGIALELLLRNPKSLVKDNSDNAR
ncbi:MAG: hypothetical protein MUO57_15340 [Anaerolineales bacterium]|nr:hypothetical protein [Anaerolineales bacterium]